MNLKNVVLPILPLILALGLASVPARGATENTAPAAAQPADASQAPDSMTALFGDPTIVKGDGFEIKRSELDQVLSSAKATAAAQGKQLPVGYDASVLEQLINIHLLLSQANDADRAAGKADADQQFAILVKNMGSESALEQQLQARGMTVAELRAKAVQEATAKAALKRLLKVSVSDSELQEYYTNHPSDFEVPETVSVRHILLMTVDPSTHPFTPLPTNTVAMKRQQIDGLLKQARGGADFAALARQYSEDPGSRDNGGELPPFPRGQMLPEFETAAFSLTNNEISDVVTTAYGFHIIKMLGKNPAHMLTLSEKSPSTDLTISEELREALINNKERKLAPDYIKQVRAADHVQVVDPNLKTEDDAFLAAQSSQGASQGASAPGPAN